MTSSGIPTPPGGRASRAPADEALLARQSSERPAEPIIRVEGLAKDYRLGGTVVPALRGVSLAIQRGELIAVTGPSGSGKSTFLNLIGCLDRPTAGHCWLEGRPIERLSRARLAAIRNRAIGFVFQTFNLLPRATALENVMLPLLYAGVTGGRGRRRAFEALESVGLADRAGHRPGQLSGGQQQRVAIARALVTGPPIILADEPTGNLDTRSSLEVMAILQELNDADVTVVVVTHEPDVAAYCRRSIAFRDGQVVDDQIRTDVPRASDVLDALAEGATA